MDEYRIPDHLRQYNSGSALPVAALGLLAILAGSAHGNVFAIAIGLPLVAGPALLWLYVRRAIDGVEIERDVPEAAFEGDTVHVRVVARNRGRLPIYHPLLLDVFSPELFAVKRLVFPGRIDPGDEIAVTYVARCVLPRGVYRLPAATLVLSDPFGWISRARRLAVEQSMKVYPTLLDLGLDERLGEVVDALREDRAFPRRGESLEFFAAREYRPGDPPRRIHWPLTAHRGTPVVREHTRPSAGDLHVAVDLCRAAQLGTGRGSSLEHAVKVAVALARRAARAGIRVRLIAQDSVDRGVPAGGGPLQVRRILDAVADVRSRGDMPLGDVLASRLREMRRGDALVVPVSAYLFESTAFAAALADIRRRGLRVVALVFDDTTFRAVWRDETPATGARDAAKAHLAAAGVETVDVYCNMDLERLFTALG